MWHNSRCCVNQLLFFCYFFFVMPFLILFSDVLSHCWFSLIFSSFLFFFIILLILFHLLQISYQNILMLKKDFVTWFVEFSTQLPKNLVPDFEANLKEKIRYGFFLIPNIYPLSLFPSFPAFFPCLPFLHFTKNWILQLITFNFYIFFFATPFFTLFKNI